MKVLFCGDIVGRAGRDAVIKEVPRLRRELGLDALPVATVLGWYAKPSPEKLPAAGSGRANFLGARDLHGLVWEWVDEPAAAARSSSA